MCKTEGEGETDLKKKVPATGINSTVHQGKRLTSLYRLKIPLVYSSDHHCAISSTVAGSAFPRLLEAATWDLMLMLKSRKESAGPARGNI